MPFSTRFGHIYIVLFWAVVMSVVWLAMERFMEPKRAVVTAQGELVIPRHRGMAVTAGPLSVSPTNVGVGL